MVIMKILNKILDYIIVFFLSSIIILTILQVFFRYVLKSPIMWGTEINIYIFIWVSFLGSIKALDEEIHMGLDIFSDSFPDKIKLVIKISTYIIILVLAIFLLKYSWDLVILSHNVKTPSLRFPRSYVYSIFPFTCICWIACSIKHIIKNYTISSKSFVYSKDFKNLK